MVRLLFLPPLLLVVVLSFSTLIFTLPPCCLNCLSSSLIKAKSSAGRSLNLSVISATFFKEAFDGRFFKVLTFFGYEILSAALAGVVAASLVLEDLVAA